MWIYGGISGLCAILLCSAYTVVVTSARGAIRRRDGIPGSDCEDCCCSFWCKDCTMCMIFRHEGVSGNKYSLCSETGVVQV